MTELPPDIAAILAAARDAHDPTEADQERVLRRVYAVSAIAAGTGVAASSSISKGGIATGTGKLAGTALPLAKLSGIGAGVTAKIVGGALLLLTAGGSYTWLARHERVAPAVVTTPVPPPVTRPSVSNHQPQVGPAAAAQPVVAPPADEASAPAVDAVPPGDVAVRQEAGDVAPRGSHTPSARARAASGNVRATSETAPAVAEELRLVRAALGALRDGQAARALSLLHEHAQRFPHGTFTEERRGAEVLALCADGQLAAGQKARRAFLHVTPASPMADSVRAACGGEEP